VATFHRIIGYAIVGGCFVLFAWGGVAFLAKRQPNQWFWWILAALQVTLAVQLVAGSVLLVAGRRSGLLHYAYGALFPAIVLVVAHVVARSLDDRGDGWKVFAIAGFVLFGLTLRALGTGLGLP
jgi:hypothetical protein